MYTSLPYARLIFCTYAAFPFAKFLAKPLTFLRHEKNCPDEGAILGFLRIAVKFFTDATTCCCT